MKQHKLPARVDSCSTTMETFMFAEYADMLLIYGETRCNGRVSCRLYVERYPERRISAHTMFERLNR